MGDAFRGVEISEGARAHGRLTNKVQDTTMPVDLPTLFKTFCFTGGREGEGSAWSSGEFFAIDPGSAWHSLSQVYSQSTHHLLHMKCMSRFYGFVC